MVKGHVLLLLLFVGLAIAPFAYLLCFAFKSPVASQALFVFLCVFFPIIITTIKLLPATMEVYASYIRYFVMLLPGIAFMSVGVELKHTPLVND